MPFSPTITHPSTELPGVSFVVHRIGFGRRTDLDFATLKFRQRLRELEADHPPRSDREKELSEQLGIANRKAAAVPADQFEAVMAADVAPLIADLEACVPADVKKARAVLNEEYLQVEARIRQEWVRRGLVSIAGGDLDELTVEQFLDYGPSVLAFEIYTALGNDGRLKGEAVPNLSPPIISGEVAGGEKTNTTADAAGVQPEAGTSTETASSISPAT